jgi:hypothetical protein
VILLIEMLPTSGCSVATTTSPGVLTAKPNTSNPQARLATVAGAKAVAVMGMGNSMDEEISLFYFK